MLNQKLERFFLKTVKMAGMQNGYNFFEIQDHEPNKQIIWFRC